MFDTSSAFGVQNVYSDVVGTDGAPNTITDTLITPYGNVNIPTTFDATAALSPATFTDPSTTGGYSFLANAGFVTSIGGTPIQDQAVSGIEDYTVTDASGSSLGDVAGIWSNDVKAVGPSDQEILVDYPEASAPGLPSDGSIFNTIDYGNGFENVYTDIVGTGGAPNTFTDTFVTPFGDVNLPTTFDAAVAEQAAEFTYPANSPEAGDTFVAQSAYIGAIAGHPPLDQSVSTGDDTYDVNNASGTNVGDFTGVSTHTVDALGLSNQEILMTGSGDTTLTDGSIFDTWNFGGGFENVYIDIVGTTGAPNTITDTFVTPFGDVNVPTAFDATSALPVAEFIAPGASTAADLASALNPVDSLFGLSGFLTF